MSKLLDIKEASELLRVSQRTVHRLVQDGDIRVVRVRGTLRFHPDDIDAYVATASQAVGS